MRSEVIGIGLMVVVVAMTGCVQRTIEIPRTELANVPTDGKVVVIDESGAQHQISAR